MSMDEVFGHSSLTWNLAHLRFWPTVATVRHVQSLPDADILRPNASHDKWKKNKKAARAQIEAQSRPKIGETSTDRASVQRTIENASPQEADLSQGGEFRKITSFPDNL